MFDVVALGEVLIDFTPAGWSSAGNMLFECNPGGAPANVLTEVARLGGSSAFIGKVGDDQFGRFLSDVLRKNDIDIRGMRASRDVNTTLAFVHLDAEGERDFSFYRNPGADIMMREEEVDLQLIDQSRIFHFGSLSLTDEPVRSATLRALEFAGQRGRLISYDPNWRPPLWRNEESARKGMSLGLKFADVLKVSIEEMTFLTGETDLERGVSCLLRGNAELVVVTLGADGCYYRGSCGAGRLRTHEVEVVDTTGAGDAFMGGLLYGLSCLQKPLKDISRRDLEEILDLANACGALSTTRRGGIPALPDMNEVGFFRQKFLRKGDLP